MMRWQLIGGKTFSTKVITSSKVKRFFSFQENPNYLFRDISIKNNYYY